ncbi:E3 ubiquitin-protein ligase TTC3 isoform X2 [Triplophysa dalaica]|uniref:E3 ubiquitin-protein ligase TTC3 isoform X2 n=1 Tax=Triplophysa dalaica TaxID=1582913 RepID=UPI0024E00FE5|nr:E3 ubiquitin-protein ligase TTC3 isoform X2 [Triplophysa dalaica]
MLDGEDSDLDEGPDVIRHKTKIVYQSDFPYIQMEPPDVIYERWAKIKPEVKKQMGHTMHISVFWRHILLRQQDNNPTTIWAVDMGFLDSNVSNDLSLRRLKKIEVLETILEAMEMGLSRKEMERKARAVVSINMSFTMHKRCLTDALSWLQDSGAPNIGDKLLELDSLDIRYGTLRFIFNEYARYLQVVSCSKKKAMQGLRCDPDAWSLQKSEEMKNKGNDQFQKKRYDMAIKWYTKAIKYHPINHILYGNRSLCFIRSEKYLKALGDGKRAIVLQPDWAKGHYRFCDALFYLGEHPKALEANRLAQSSCSADPEGYKDLLQQYDRFQTELQEAKAELVKSKKIESKKNSSKARAHIPSDCSSQPVKSCHLSEPASESSLLENLRSEKQHESSEDSGALAEDRSHTNRDLKSNMTPRKSKKSSLNTPEKPAVRSKHPPAPDRQENLSDAVKRERFCAAVQEGHEALKDQRCRNAQQSFSLAVSMLDSNIVTDLGLSQLDKCILLYGYGTALLEVGQPEELGEARRLFTKLESSERQFQSLVHYGMGRVYLKENRFAKALEHFSNALLIIQRHITPGKLTWPTTRVLLEETQPAFLQERLENLVDTCTFPPKPDAVCCHSHCLTHSLQIYFSDPDFKGFIQLICCQKCRVEFHMTCWKKLKSLSFTDKSDKDFLQDQCFTPDCEGQICHIVIFGSTGLIKCEFETPIPKTRPSGRMKIRQQCTSIKKLKSKNDRKLRQKQHRLAARADHLDENDVIAADVPAKRATPKHSFIVDPVLHQIHENKELFKEESGNISCVLEHLQPWLDLYDTKGHESVLKGFREDVTLSELVDVLLEASNRVWVRVFIETMDSWLPINPRLQQWAHQLDSAGLKAAESFISRYSSHLQQLDLQPLLTFAPLKNALLKTFDTIQELFNSNDFTLMEYLRQAPAKDARLFIWALESGRERYQSCHFILDQYFEDDAVCLVIKKMEDDENINTVFKSKTRHRKKKQKDSKSVVLLSGMRGGHSRDEDEDEDLFSEDDPFLFLSGGDPFSVPDHLRGQLAEFEEQYSGSAHRSYYDRILDNNTDPTKESLYDYFAQILEEHGPLCASDPLMVGELENFPLEARQKITTAGGLEAFLLESLRFAMTDDVMGLMKHVVSLTNPSQASQMSHLNPTAKEFWPQTDVLSDDGSHVHGASFDSSAESLLSFPVTSDSILLPDLYSPEGPVADFPLEYVSAQYTSSAAGETAVSVQASDETKDVCINTEPLIPFEENNGDMTQMEKETLCLSEKVEQMKADVDDVQLKRGELISSLQEELEKITHRAQIAAAELALFQQKLEDEVKKDQQEKRENQETLKMLKMNIKDLTDTHETFNRDIRHRNKEYQTELERCLDVSNQCAAERMSLEDESKRHRDACVRDQRRSVTAQLSVLQSQKDHGLRCLRARLFEGMSVVKHMTEASHSFPPAVLLSAMDDWKRFVCDVEDKIKGTEMVFDSRMNEVKNGTRLCSLSPVSVPSPPAPPPAPGMFPAALQQSHYTHMPRRTPTPTGRSTPQPSEKHPEESAVRAANGQQHLTVYERMLERLNGMFPHYNRLVLNKFIQEVRSANGGTLNPLTYEDVINRVAQLILDHQENMREHMNFVVGDLSDRVPHNSTGSENSARASGTPPLTQVWRNVSEKHRNAALALNMEDPCIICHEDMSAEDMCVLECRHSFHRQCIKSWLKEQSTCPTCREHALLPEDFPVLPGKHRKSHVSAAAHTS